MTPHTLAEISRSLHVLLDIHIELGTATHKHLNNLHLTSIHACPSTYAALFDQ
jgi:hypothetical protein